jgi:hypothetical protein
MIKTTNYLIIFLMLLSSCSYKVQTKNIVLKDNNNQPYSKIVKVIKSVPITNYFNQSQKNIKFASVKLNYILEVSNSYIKYSPLKVKNNYNSEEKTN